MNFHQVFQKKLKNEKMKNSTYTKKKSNSESGLLRNPMILPFETKKRRRKNCEEKKITTYLIIKKICVCMSYA